MDIVRKMFLLEQALKSARIKNSEIQRPWKLYDNPDFPYLCLCSLVFFGMEGERYS